MVYLTNTFSPKMLGKSTIAQVVEIGYHDALGALRNGFTSAVSHEVTAKVLSALIGKEVAFNRMNVTLREGDVVVAIIPNFRADVAREFSREEIESAGVSYYLVTCS